MGIAEQFARFMGTAKFLIYMTLFVVIWVGWNLLAPEDWRWDDYPFIFLTLMLSLQASYAAPLILLAQNRQESRDKVVLEQDRQANARAHADMEFLAREVASLRMSVGEVAAGLSFGPSCETCARTCTRTCTRSCTRMGRMTSTPPADEGCPVAHYPWAS